MLIQLHSSEHIAGVYRADLRAFADERGKFRESFRVEWFPQVSWERLQTNFSISKPNVLRGLHYHHHQVDYWYLQAGHIRVGLADLRPQSQTFMAVEIVEMQANEGCDFGLFIPIGVAHGFFALTDVMLTYVVNNYYDSSDEFGVAWNDPQLGVPWGVDDPLLSPRDKGNPLLKDIPPAQLP